MLNRARAGAAEPLFALLSGNSKHIQSLIALVATLHGCLEPQQGGEPRAPQILTVNDFLFSKGLDNLNLFRLIRYALRQHWRHVNMQRTCRRGCSAVSGMLEGAMKHCHASAGMCAKARLYRRSLGMRRGPPGPICPTRRTSPAMVLVKPVDLPVILRSFPSSARGCLT